MFKKLSLILVLLINCLAVSAQAEVLSQAMLGIKISLAKPSSSRPMTVAYHPDYKKYYVADGGLGALPGDMDAAVSKSEIHVFDEQGKYLQSVKPGFDNRVIYFNPNTKQLETITYNVSSDAGFMPNTGIFGLETTENGSLKESSKDILGPNPAFGDSATMPSYNSTQNVYYAKQKRSNLVNIVDLKIREKIGLITLDFAAANTQHDDVADSFIAYTAVAGNELALLDVDHKTVLIFDLNGKLIGKSVLPADLKLRSKNHYNGLGYANGMIFIYHEPEGEFGTYYGFKVVK